MKRWLSSLVIIGYLSILGYGVVCHTLAYRIRDTPLMYYIVWDMFCGWSAYADATKIIAEGESGKYYELSPGPWGEIIPYGSVGRHDYDSTKDHYVSLAKNTLRHTQHEPIARIFVLEEVWAKKFDVPDHIWTERYGEAKDTFKYYRQRAEMNGNCQVVRTYMGWIDNQSLVMLADNPRLIADSRKSQSVFTLDKPRIVQGQHVSSPKGN